MENSDSFTQAKISEQSKSSQNTLILVVFFVFILSIGALVFLYQQAPEAFNFLPWSDNDSQDQNDQQPADPEFAVSLPELQEPTDFQHFGDEVTPQSTLNALYLVKTEGALYYTQDDRVYNVSSKFETNPEIYMQDGEIIYVLLDQGSNYKVYIFRNEDSLIMVDERINQYFELPREYTFPENLEDEELEISFEESQYNLWWSYFESNIITESYTVFISDENESEFTLSIPEEDNITIPFEINTEGNFVTQITLDTSDNSGYGFLNLNYQTPQKTIDEIKSIPDNYTEANSFSEFILTEPD